MQANGEREFVLNFFFERGHKAKTVKTTDANRLKLLLAVSFLDYY